MEFVMTFVTENQSFSLSRYHDLFPSFFPLHVFELIDVMGFEVSSWLFRYLITESIHGHFTSMHHESASYSNTFAKMRELDGASVVEL
jgi:hypothetical protein